MRNLLFALLFALPVTASASSPSFDDATYAPPSTHVTLTQVERQPNPYDDAGMNGPAAATYASPSTHVTLTRLERQPNPYDDAGMNGPAVQKDARPEQRQARSVPAKTSIPDAACTSC